MNKALNFEHCYLATGCNISAGNIALLLPENTLTEHYAALWQVAYADNKLWQESFHLDQLGIPGVSGGTDYPPGICLWRITELSAFCREVVEAWLLRRKSHGMQLAALLAHETPCYHATLLDDPEAGYDWQDEIFITTYFDKNIWRSLRTVLADPAQEYRNKKVAELLVHNGLGFVAYYDTPIRYVTAAIHLLTGEQIHNGILSPFGIAEILQSLRRIAAQPGMATEDIEQAMTLVKQPRNWGIVCQPKVNLLLEGTHVVDLLLQLRFEDVPDSVAA